MIKLENLKVYNIVDAMRGMRNPMESWHLNDSYSILTQIDQGYSQSLTIENGNKLELYEKFIIGPKDLKLAKALSKAGNDHAKYLRQIFVSVDITAPIDLWTEIDTYEFTVRNSTSTMHKLGSRTLIKEDFSFEDFTDEQVHNELNRINKYLLEWYDAGKKKPSPEWRRLKRALAVGFLYRSTWTTNYQVLKTIANSDRKNHRLTEWHEFIKFFVDNTPYFKELCILGEKEND